MATDAAEQGASCRQGSAGLKGFRIKEGTLQAPSQEPSGSRRGANEEETEEVAVRGRSPAAIAALSESGVLHARGWQQNSGHKWRRAASRHVPTQPRSSTWRFFVCRQL